MVFIRAKALLCQELEAGFAHGARTIVVRVCRVAAIARIVAPLGQLNRSGLVLVVRIRVIRRSVIGLIVDLQKGVGYAEVKAGVVCEIGAALLAEACVLARPTVFYAVQALHAGCHVEVARTALQYALVVFRVAELRHGKVAQVAAAAPDEPIVHFL